MLAIRLQDLPRAKLTRRLVANALRIALGTTAAEAEPDGDDLLPPEIRPVIDPPGPYRRPAVVSVSERLVASLRKDYAPGRPTDDGRRIGDLPEVATWLETLTPGKFSPGVGP